MTRLAKATRLNLAMQDFLHGVQQENGDVLYPSLSELKSMHDIPFGVLRETAEKEKWFQVRRNLQKLALERLKGIEREIS